MSRNIIKLARGTKSSIETKLTNGNLAEYEIVYATDTKEIGVVNTGLESITWSGALDYANIADNLRVATQSKKGAMSAQDKTNLDTLMDLLGSEQADADQIVNNIREVLDAFENFPEGTDLLTKFTELDNGKVDKLTTKLTAGTYTKVTVNTEGQVTEGTSLAASNIPSLSANKITSGTFPVERGGTGKATFTSGEVLVGNGTGAVSTLSRDGIDTRTAFPPSTHNHDDEYLKLAGGTVSSLKVEQQLSVLELNLGAQHVFPKLNWTLGTEQGEGLEIRLKDETPGESTSIVLTMSSLNMRGIPVSNTTIDGGYL